MNDIMNMAELSDYLGITYDRARWLVNESPDMPRIRIKSRRYFRKSSIDEWLDQKETTECTEKITTKKKVEEK